MGALGIIKKMSKLYVKGLLHPDQIHQFVVICMDILRELEIAKISNEATITLKVDGREHKQLLNLVEASNESPIHNSK